MNPPTADELAAIRRRDEAHQQGVREYFPKWGLLLESEPERDRHTLLALVVHLQTLNVSLAERVAAQSELLSKKAEKGSTTPDDQLPTLASLRGLLMPLAYDPDFGDERLCACGHPYYRHFDSYEDMRPVGCKYCRCDKFTEKGGPLDIE